MGAYRGNGSYKGNKPAKNKPIGAPSERGPLPGSLDLYMHDTRRYSMFSSQAEEIFYIRKAQKGDELAAQRVITSHLRFVISIAKKYQNQGLPLSDLINEGNIGLMRALPKYDESHGVKFISYAVWWVRQGILKSLADNGANIRMPLNLQADMRAVNKRANAIVQEKGVKLEEAVALAVKELDITEERMAAAQQVHKMVSLDQPIVKGEKGTIGERLADAGNNTFTAVAQNNTLDAMSAALHRYELKYGEGSERDTNILRHYFGLDDGKEHTLEEIGEMLGITRERVRQLKERALKRLRADKSVKELAQNIE